MATKTPQPAVGLLASGGLDSCILLGHLLSQGNDVQPFYVRTGTAWEEAEIGGLQRFMERLGSRAGRQARDLVLLSLPLDDLYVGHWSLTGQSVPDENTPDEAVSLPGRNALLTIKPAVWCQMHGLTQLALATLKSNPFPDATDEFFTTLQTAYSIGLDRKIEILRPFEHLGKCEVMRLSDNFPLGDSFSCIAPVGLSHCGRCNKCAERKRAFRDANLRDPTVYA